MPRAAGRARRDKLTATDPDHQAAALTLRLAPDPTTPAGPPALLDEVDHGIAEILRLEGRTPLEEISAATGRAVGTLRRRLARMRSERALYFGVDYDYRALETPIETVLWLTVRPGRLVETGTALAEHPGVAFAAAITGPTATLFASLLSANPRALFGDLATTIGALPHVQQIESVPVLRAVRNL